MGQVRRKVYHKPNLQRSGVSNEEPIHDDGNGAGDREEERASAEDGDADAHDAEERCTDVYSAAFNADGSGTPRSETVSEVATRVAVAAADAIQCFHD